MKRIHFERENLTNNTTELVFILDKSGSMAGLEADTIGGFNSLIEKQKKEEGVAYVTAVLFDNDSEFLYDRVELKKVSKMEDKDYIPGGCTALLDAVRGTRAFLFVELLLYTGLRRGEALGLMWSDIDFQKEELHVSRSIVFTNDNQTGEINPDLKTSNARRDIPIYAFFSVRLKEKRRFFFRNSGNSA